MLAAFEVKIFDKVHSTKRVAIMPSDKSWSWTASRARRLLWSVYLPRI